MYSIDEDGTEFAAFAEELEHAAELLLNGGLARERMAMVILDSLAERLLHQHAHRCFHASEAPVAVFTEPFPAERRRDILDHFNAKVRLALEDERFFVFIDPLLDQRDAEIFRVAHRYRNAGYHRGEHNRALTGPLARLYGRAIGRAFVRSASHCFRSFGADEVPYLNRFGWQHGTEERVFLPQNDTESITLAITEPLAVDVPALAEQLATDSEARIRVVEDTVDSLRRDLGDEQIGQLIEAAQRWAQHRGDERLHELTREAEVLKDRLDDEDELNDRMVEDLQRNAVDRLARVVELSEESDIRVDLGSIEALTRRAARLKGKVDVPPLLQAYRELDELLEILELAVEWVFRSWDQSVQQAIDEARGK